MNRLKDKRILFWLFIVGIYLIIFLFIKDFRIVQDEYYHFNQIQRFVAGDVTLNPALTTIPGYHLLMATVIRIFQTDTLIFIRLINSILGLWTVVLFYILAKLIDRKHAVLKTIQFAFFPLVVPFMFLVYTDIFSLGLLLATFYLVYKGRFNQAGFTGLLSLLVRQNNVVWLVFYLCLIYLEIHGNSFHWKKAVQYLKQSWFLLLDILLFMLFILWHKGFSLGNEQMHPVSFFKMGNVYLILFLFAFLFLPYMISSIGKVIREIRIIGPIRLIKKYKIVLLMAPFLILFPAFTFVNDHPYNWTWWFLHNFFLVFFTADIFRKLIFFTIVTISLYALGVMKLEKKSFYLLYPFTVLFLAPSWLIEARYYIVPFIFFILFKKEQSILTALVQIVYEFVLTTVVLVGILNWWFFV